MDFKAEFSRKYFPSEAIYRTEHEFSKLCQGNMTVRVYEAEFDRLSRFSSRALDEEELVRMFIRGMRIELQNHCEMNYYPQHD